MALGPLPTRNSESRSCRLAAILRLGPSPRVLAGWPATCDFRRDGESGATEPSTHREQGLGAPTHLTRATFQGKMANLLITLIRRFGAKTAALAGECGVHSILSSGRDFIKSHFGLLPCSCSLSHCSLVSRL